MFHCLRWQTTIHACRRPLAIDRKLIFTRSLCLHEWLESVDLIPYELSGRNNVKFQHRNEDEDMNMQSTYRLTALAYLEYPNCDLKPPMSCSFLASLMPLLGPKSWSSYQLLSLPNELSRKSPTSQINSTSHPKTPPSTANTSPSYAPAPPKTPDPAQHRRKPYTSY